ncbi:hypothetical protein QYF61_019719 [Mycteria americana]|uniref:Uncharacterized protein n=1 Tax=Mycteria americana TaxID=33587 RepID=A0AAN7RZF1_MYCAM|nr:hypothetical protein QYF61_019719 [Mycteria americana]
MQSPAQGRNNPVHQHRLGADRLESSFAQKYLWVLLDTKLPMGQERALMAQRANSLLGCLRQSIASRSREVPPMEAPLEYGETYLGQISTAEMSGPCLHTSRIFYCSVLQQPDLVATAQIQHSPLTRRKRPSYSRTSP